MASADGGHAPGRSNRVLNSSRWGIAVRSNGDAASLANLIELNWIDGSGQTTRDLGGISLMGSATPGTRTVIRSNCVRNMVGTDSASAGVSISARPAASAH